MFRQKAVDTGGIKPVITWSHLGRNNMSKLMKSYGVHKMNCVCTQGERPTDHE